MWSALDFKRINVTVIMIMDLRKQGDQLGGYCSSPGEA